MDWTICALLMTQSPLWHLVLKTWWVGGAAESAESDQGGSPGRKGKGREEGSGRPCVCVCVVCVLVCTHACAHTCFCVIISESHCHLTWNCCSCPSTVLPETDRIQQSEQLQSEIQKLEACSGLTVHTHTHTCCNTYCPYTGCHHGDWLTSTSRPTAGYAMSILQISENDSVGSNFTNYTLCNILCSISLWCTLYTVRN